jgi:hypothetical protein
MTAKEAALFEAMTLWDTINKIASQPLVASPGGPDDVVALARALLDLKYNTFGPPLPQPGEVDPDAEPR